MVINTHAVKLHKMKETPIMKEEIFIKTNRIGYIPQLGIQGPIVNPYPVTRAIAKEMIVAGISVVEVHKDGSTTELNLQNVFPGEGDVKRDPAPAKPAEAPNKDEKKEVEPPKAEEKKVEESKKDEPKTPAVQPVTFSGVAKEAPAEEKKEESKVEEKAEEAKEEKKEEAPAADATEAENDADDSVDGEAESEGSNGGKKKKNRHHNN